jgi:hypothetical protein
MAQSKDFALRYGIKKAVGNTPSAAELYGGGTYPTTGANSQVRWSELTITDTPEKYEDVSSTGNQWSKQKEVSAVPVTWSGKTEVFVDNSLTELVSAFGYEELSGPVNYDTTKYSHLISLLPMGKDQRLYNALESIDASANASLSPAYNTIDIINTYMKIGAEYGPYDEFAENAQVGEFTLSCEAKSPLMLEMSGTAEEVTRDVTKAESANWTDRVGCDEAKFFMRHATANFGPVGSAIDVAIFNFSVSGSLGVAADLFPTGTANNGLSRAEPVSTGKQAVTVEFSINKHDTINYKNYEQTDTECQLAIDFVRGDKRCIILLPSLNVISATPEISDGSKINITAEAFIPCGADPFTAQRSISGTEQTLTYPQTPLYMVLSNANAENGLRYEG